MALTAVVLAAGAGRRLGELGRASSKAMLAVAGRPLVGWVIERLRAAGAERIVVVGHPSDGGLATWLAAHPAGVELARQAERGGIAAAVAVALPLLAPGESYLACACDSLFAPADIAALIARGRAHPGAAAVGVLDMGAAATASRSAVRLDGDRVVGLVEKPDPGTAPSGIVAAPLYWLPRAVDPLLTATQSRGGERHVSSALDDFIRGGGSVWAVRLNGRIEVTTAADVAAAERALGS